MEGLDIRTLEIDGEKADKRIERICAELKSKYRKTLRWLNDSNPHHNRYYLLKEEIEPVLTKEEADFIGFWSGEISGKPLHITEDGIEKRRWRLIYEMWGDYLKENMKGAGRGKWRK